MDTSSQDISMSAGDQGTGGRGCSPAALAFVALFGFGFIGFFMFSGISWKNFSGSFKEMFTNPTVAPPGDVRAFDPITSFPEVKKYAGEGVSLTDLRATYVRSDGTLDLKADLSPSPYVSYQFERKVAAEKDAPPIGAGVGLDGMQWQRIDVDVENPGKTTYVSKMGGGINTKYSYKNYGMSRDENDPQGSNYDKLLSDPVCSFKDLWTQVIKKGAPANALATITYDEDGYDFRIQDTDISAEFTNSCLMKRYKSEELINEEDLQLIQPNEPSQE